MNNNNLNITFNLNIETTVFSTQYISTEELESKENKNFIDKSLSPLLVNIRRVSRNKSFLYELMSLVIYFQIS